MSRYKPILIGCPQFRGYVRGEYECDESGGYALSADGEFMLSRARCGHHGGRCMQTLCVLHRHNRLGKRSWYPECILALADAQPKSTTSAAVCPDPAEMLF